MAKKPEQVRVDAVEVTSVLQAVKTGDETQLVFILGDDKGQILGIALKRDVAEEIAETIRQAELRPSKSPKLSQ